MIIVSGIYIIRNKKTNKFYIGSSHNVHNRLRTHRNLLNRNAHFNIHLQRSWNKDGSKSFEFKILERVDLDRLLEREEYWIQTLDATNDKKGYNICRFTVKFNLGRKLNNETKAKMSKAQMGRKHSPETKIKISNANRGNKPSETAIAKSRLANLGKKASEETKAKLREIHKNPSPELRYKFGNANRGKKLPKDQVDRIAAAHMKEFILTSPNGEVFTIKGLAKFCREQGLDQGSMSRIASGRAKTYKGWKCERVKNQ